MCCVARQVASICSLTFVNAEAAQARAQAAAKRGLPNGGPTPTNAASGGALVLFIFGAIGLYLCVEPSRRRPARILRRAGLAQLMQTLSGAANANTQRRS
jgi:hypothetical protein